VVNDSGVLMMTKAGAKSAEPAQANVDLAVVQSDIPSATSEISNGANGIGEDVDAEGEDV
jgi:hypothetical protein